MIEKKVRESNFELMRIISMLMIIFWHIMVHGDVLDNAQGTLKIVLTFIQAIIYIHVNSFVLVTGYFQSDSRFKFSKVIQLNNSIWFYKAGIALLLISLGVITLEIVPLLKIVSPITHYDYWFMSTYLFLYLLSPILNIVINNISKNNYKKMLLLLIILFSILPFLTNQEIYGYSFTNSILHFVILYFIGGYFRKYKVDDSYYLKRFSLETKKLILLLIFFCCAFISFLITLASNSFIGLGSIANYIGISFSGMIRIYNNPILIFQSICYFLFFSLIKIKSKWINIISSTTMGIYLIHDNSYLRKEIYNFFGFENISYSCTILIKMFICTIIIFVCCSLIELIRQKTFKFIYNRKFSKKIRVGYRNYIKKLGINIRW